MSARLDGFAILRAVVRHSELFSEVRAAVDKAAVAILTAQLKPKTCDLDRLKRTRKAVGADMLALILKQLPDTVPKSLTARIDPHHRKHAHSSARRARSRVMALAGGTATPQQERPGAGKRKADSAISRSGSAKGRNKGRNESKGRKLPKPEKDGIAKGFWATSVMAKPQRLSRSARKPK